jgi:SNF2 family DNA or RNA helicase
MKGLAEKLKAAGITFEKINGDTPADRRAEIINEYQQGKYQTLLCSPKALSHGATLTVADTIIWASPVRSTEEFAQFNARIDRIGQTQRNEVIMIAAQDTYEIRAYDLLLTKVNRQLSLLELLGD